MKQIISQIINKMIILNIAQNIINHLQFLIILKIF